MFCSIATQHIGTNKLNMADVMDATKMFNKVFMKLDMIPDFDFQTRSFKVYLLLCKKKVELWLTHRSPLPLMDPLRKRRKSIKSGRITL